LGEEEIKLTKKAYGWPEDKKFFVPDEVQKLFRDCIVAHGQKANADWNALFTEYKKQYAEQAGEIEHIVHGDLPAGWDAEMQPFPADAKGMASRVSSGKVLNQIAKHVPWLIGGSADLAPSTNTLLTFEKVGDFEANNHAGRNLHFGIREHVMGSILNGMVLSGLRAYGATFFVFSDYMRPPIRLAAIMGLPAIYVFTHDSIGVGEDGPTHQPIEQLAALRAIPRLLVVRPADANEVSEAYKIAMQHTDRPTALILTRQNLPTLDRTKFAAAAGTAKGGYILADAADGKPDVILIGTGSEVSLSTAAYEKLAAEGVKVRVVSMPCWQLFDEQPAEYRDAVLPPNVTSRVAVELGVKQGWEKYIGVSGKFIGMCGYGTSAPLEVVLKHFGMTIENVVAAAKELCIRKNN
jgi:transketolase